MTTASTTAHNIRVSITADAPTFALDDGLWITTRVENVGRSALHWYTDGCNRHVSVPIRTGFQWTYGAEQFEPYRTYKNWALGYHRSPEPRPIALYSTPEWAVDRGVYGCADVGILHELEPGESVDSRLFVNDGSRRGNTDGPPPAGPILLTGSFDLWCRGNLARCTVEQEPIVVELAIEMTDGRDPGLLSPGQAIDVGLSAPEIAAAIREHPAIPDWSPHLLEFERETEQWTVGITLDASKAVATEGQALARQITAIIDARTARVLEVREEALGG